MDRYWLEPEVGCWVIRDMLSGELVQHQVLRMPERFRTQLRAVRRLRELQEADRLGWTDWRVARWSRRPR
jgi:hypothetical protein